MYKRLIMDASLAVVLFGFGVRIWIWLGVRDAGLPPVNERLYMQSIASHQDN